MLGVLRRLGGDDAGGAAVLFALALPVVVGGLGIGAEAGLWYFTQRKLQNAADVAAYAAATEIRAGRPSARVEAAAAAAAAESGYRADRGAIMITTPYAGSVRDVEVLVVERLPRSFSALFAEGSVEIGGRAVARISEGVRACVVALDPQVPRAVTFSGNSETILVGCNVHANSLAPDALYIQGNPFVTADCVSAAGGVHLQSDEQLRLTRCVAPYQRADIVPDPYADLPVPDLTQPCEKQNSFGGGAGATHTIGPGRYCGGLTMSRNVTMLPGIYVVEGDVTIGSQAAIAGEGVTIYLRGGGEFDVQGTPQVQLTAPQTGDYEGILIFADRQAPPGTTHKINGNAQSYFNGAIYARQGHVDYLGNNATGGGCSQVVARTVRFTGNSSVGMDCNAAGFRDIRSAQLITLVE